MRAARGFSLIELLAVLAILAVLAWAMLPLAVVSREREREHELQRALWQIRDAIDAYKKVSDATIPASSPRPSGVSGYPPTLAALVQGLPDPRAAGRTIYFLRRVPRDPFAPEALPAERTWGLRSFASPADAPAPGADVYDVHSLAEGKGLNGVPLRQW
ncbi:MAG: type II secretion system protein [Burkholderiaceae bacterium]